MTQYQRSLARALATCPHFRWCAGMRAAAEGSEADDWWLDPLRLSGGPRFVGVVEPFEGDAYCIGPAPLDGRIPDLDDPGTIGALLGLLQALLVDDQQLHIELGGASALSGPQGTVGESVAEALLRCRPQDAGGGA